MHLWNNATLRTFVFFIALSIGSPLLAETPCDFKGLSVGDNMSPAEIMAALGVKQYRTNPASPSFDQMMAGAKKYGLIASSEMQDWTIGPYCH